ncbi:hypothetical protein G5I_01885 [Acromyrmex echinatior]|uniref:DUF8207 domain-containing protein n=1 Tax=Acromyrmex echinatior TaxID=103372 RepID=F4W8U8_ACREC|nr:hypothetical protein G5I_01885 [Acromyrmex echinatior]
MVDVREREKIAREIKKTSESIRKKHRALKTGKIEDMALDRHFKPIIKSLRQIVNSPGVQMIKRQSRDDDAASASKRERKEEKVEEEEKEEEEKASETFERLRINPMIDRTIIDEGSKSANIERSRGVTSWLGLDQKYVEAVLRRTRDKQKNGTNYVYGVYLYNDGLIFGNKRFDVDDADNVIIDGVRYAGTPGFYELIFKRIPDDLLYTEDYMNKYRNILLAPNVHKYKHHSQEMSNREYKYKYQPIHRWCAIDLLDKSPRYSTASHFGMGVTMVTRNAFWDRCGIRSGGGGAGACGRVWSGGGGGSICGGGMLGGGGGGDPNNM